MRGGVLLLIIGTFLITRTVIKDSTGRTLPDRILGTGVPTGPSGPVTIGGKTYSAATLNPQTQVLTGGLLAPPKAGAGWLANIIPKATAAPAKATK